MRSLILAVLAAAWAGCNGDNLCPGGCGVGAACDPNLKACVCASGSTLCGGACVNLLSDPNNCAGCGFACWAGERCQDGRCTDGNCAKGAKDCSGQCVDASRDPRNCGGCGKLCGAGLRCKSGVCETATNCAYGMVNCQAGCASLQWSNTNGGACFVTCLQDKVCVRGTCIAAGDCPSGLTNCEGQCVDLLHDPANCGGCTVHCGRGQICATDGRGAAKCALFDYAPCSTCPCAGCGSRSCCMVPSGDGSYDTLCISGGCPSA